MGMFVEYERKWAFSGYGDMKPIHDRYTLEELHERAQVLGLKHYGDGWWYNGEEFDDDRCYQELWEKV